MRNIVEIIDQITDVAPDLQWCLKGARSSAMYSSPELMAHQWRNVADLLETHALEHPKREQIAAIFAGKSQ